jgi:hypothetical protein
LSLRRVGICAACGLSERLEPEIRLDLWGSCKRGRYLLVVDGPIHGRIGDGQSAWPLRHGRMIMVDGAIVSAFVPEHFSNADGEM